MLLHDKLKPYRLLLASRSPRRRQLIADCALQFTLADDYEVDEIFPSDIPAHDVSVYLAELKSNAYPSTLNDNDILITADTVVICSNEIIGKPSSRDHAIATIEKLSGKAHTVVTGVTLRSDSKQVSFSASSNVWFRVLSREEIEFYVDTYLPFDKAGAYGIQEWIGYVGIEHIEGSFYNVMGLPVQKLYTELNTFIK